MGAELDDPQQLAVGEPPALSIVVDDCDHVWQSFVSTDGSGVNLWYPAAPRWGGFSVPAKTWQELQGTGQITVVRWGKKAPTVAQLDHATRLREAVPGDPSQGPYPTSVGQVADEVVEWIRRTEPYARGLPWEVVQRLRGRVQ